MTQFNGLSDLEIESSSSVFGRLVLWAMLGVFALASMLTTFSFFAVYAPGLGRVLHPAYAGEIAGVLGVLLFDAAGLGWTVLRARNSDTSRQFVIATAAAVVTIALALLTSALYVVLSSSFDVGLYTAAGSLSDFGQTMQAVGVATMTAGFVLNFGAIAAYVNTSAAVTKAVQETQLAAYANAGRFKADQARAELVTRQTVQAILDRLPTLAATAGEKSGSAYLDRAFTQPGQTHLLGPWRESDWRKVETYTTDDDADRAPVDALRHAARLGGTVVHEGAGEWTVYAPPEGEKEPVPLAANVASNGRQSSSSQRQT